MAKKTIELNGIERTSDFGSRGSRRLLRQGRIPCIIYGQRDPLAFTISSREFSKLRGTITKTTLIDLKIEGKSDMECFLKAIQEDLISDRILHLDFYEIKRGKLLTTRVSITLCGNPVGVRDGGVLEQIERDVEVECLPRNLPDTIEIDVSGLGVNENISIKDIPPIDGVRFLADAETTIATIKYTRQQDDAASEQPSAETPASAPAATASEEKK